MSRKILFVAPSAYVLSGLATWLDYLEPGLRGYGWETIVGLVEGSRFHLPEHYVAVHQHEHWIRISCRTGTPEGRSRAVIRAVRRVQPDLVAVVNIPDVYPAVARMRQGGRFSPKVVMTLHGIQSDLYDDLREYASVIDGVVCTNRLACRLSHILVKTREERIYYAPYGVTVETPRSIHFGEGTLKIAFVGRLEQWQKRVHDLPQILEHLKRMDVPFELLIAGDGPEEAPLRKSLKTFTDEGKAIFLGRLDPDTLREEIYKKADALLLTSHWETGPIVIWEAMARGMAIVSSAYVGSGLEAALKHDDNCLLFPVGRDDLAARQIGRLAKEPGLAEHISRNGHELVCRRYSKDISVRKWDKVLRSVLSDAPLRDIPQLQVRSAMGRLDRWIGPGVAETARTLMRRTGLAADPGGEWPHSHGSTPLDDPAFWRVAADEDGRLST